MVDRRRRATGISQLRNIFQSIDTFEKLIQIYKGENKNTMGEKNQKIHNLIDSSLHSLDNLADVNKIIGKPIITASGFQVIPFSKVTMGNLSGGGEYGDIKVVKETDAMPFAGGSGAVVSMKPMGFLVDDGQNCRVIRISDEPVDNLIERATDIIREIMAKKQ